MTARHPRRTLSVRELQVLRLAANDRDNHEIGQRLFISGSTVCMHLSRIYEVLGVRSRYEAVALAVRWGLVGELPPLDLSRVSAPQVEALALLARGLPDSVIARSLGRSRATVKMQILRGIQRSGARGRMDVIRRWPNTQAGLGLAVSRAS